MQKRIAFYVLFAILSRNFGNLDVLSCSFWNSTLELPGPHQAPAMAQKIRFGMASGNTLKSSPGMTIRSLTRSTFFQGRVSRSMPEQSTLDFTFQGQIEASRAGFIPPGLDLGLQGWIFVPGRPSSNLKTKVYQGSNPTPAKCQN